MRRMSLRPPPLPLRRSRPRPRYRLRQHLHPRLLPRRAPGAPAWAWALGAPPGFAGAPCLLWSSSRCPQRPRTPLLAAARWLRLPQLPLLQLLSAQLQLQRRCPWPCPCLPATLPPPLPLPPLLLLLLPPCPLRSSASPMALGPLATAARGAAAPPPLPPSQRLPAPRRRPCLPLAAATAAVSMLSVLSLRQRPSCSSPPSPLSPPLPPLLLRPSLPPLPSPTLHACPWAWGLAQQPCAGGCSAAWAALALERLQPLQQRRWCSRSARRRQQQRC